MYEVMDDVNDAEAFEYASEEADFGGLVLRDGLPAYQRAYAYTDFFTWPDDFRAEIVNGSVFTMAPPKIRHQDVVLEIAAQIKAFLKGKPHKVCVAPVSVRLFPQADGSDRTVFEPDVVVVKDMSIVGEHGIAGVPDMLVEVLSPASAHYDRTVKYDFYERAGVKEYWIVDPDKKTVTVFLLRDGKYTSKTYQGSGTAALSVFPDCIIDLKAVFE
jgi:Uma2 family endonuclease